MKLLQLLILMTLSLSSFAAVEYRKFDNPQKEEVYNTLINEIRCLVCQNQTIADSNADLAKDLRRQVYEMLQKGKSKLDIANFMTDRYGDFVLYNPPFKAKTSLLWLGPAVFLIIGLITLILYSRKKRKVDSIELSADEKAKQEKVKAMLNQKELL